MSHTLPSATRKVAFCLTLLTLFGVAAVSAQTPLVCSGQALQVAGSSTSAQLFFIDQSVTPFVFTPAATGPHSDAVNAIGFSRNTGLIWGWQWDDGASSGELTIVDATGALFPQGLSTPALPAGTRFISGDVSVNPGGDETLFLATSNPTTLYSVNLTTMAMTSVAVALPNANDRLPDIAFNPINGKLYGGSSPIASPPNAKRIIELDPSTGADDVVAITNAPSCGTAGNPDCIDSATGFGASWFNIAGDFFIYDNGSGTIFEIALAFDGGGALDTATVIDSQPGTAVTDNDGAACLSGELGVGKQMTPTPGGGPSLPATVVIDYVFENFSVTETLNNLAAADDLTAVFGTHGVDWTFTSIDQVPPGTFDNSSYNGHSDVELINAGQSLAPGASATISVTISVLTVDAQNGDGQFCNQIEANADLGGLLIGDFSTDGTDPDPNGDGFPTEQEVSCEDAANVPVDLQTFSID